MTHSRDMSVSEVRALIAQASGRRLSALVSQFQTDERPGVRSAVASAAKRAFAEQAERARLKALYGTEAELHASGYSIVAGVDEVGRGALAGPLSAAACVLPPAPHVVGLNDSKRLSPARRREVAQEVREVAVCWSVAHVDASTIDAIGLGAALKAVMREALLSLDPAPEHVLLDGLPLRLVEHETAFVGGDGRVAAIAAASVLAKVARDEMMVGFAQAHPEYGFEINKGYGTPEHLEALSRFGRCPLHRMSFCPGKGTGSLF